MHEIPHTIKDIEKLYISGNLVNIKVYKVELPKIIEAQGGCNLEPAVIDIDRFDFDAFTNIYCENQTQKVITLRKYEDNQLVEVTIDGHFDLLQATNKFIVYTNPLPLIFKNINLFELKRDDKNIVLVKPLDYILQYGYKENKYKKIRKALGY